MIEIIWNGTPLTAVAKNLESTIRLMYPKVEIIELPNAGHIRKMWGVIRMLGDTLDAHELANNECRKQLWWDETSRCVVSLELFDADMMENNGIRSTILSYSKVNLGGLSQETAQSVMETINIWVGGLIHANHAVQTMHMKHHCRMVYQFLILHKRRAQNIHETKLSKHVV